MSNYITLIQLKRFVHDNKSQNNLAKNGKKRHYILSKVLANLQNIDSQVTII